MSQKEKNRRVVEQLYAAADEGQLDRISGYFSSDFQDHDANSARQEGATALEAMLAAFRQFLEGFPDTRHIVHDLICEGDRVVARVSAEGTHTGPAFGQPPSGRRYRNDAIVIYRFSDGKIVEKWSRERVGVVEELEKTSSESAGRASSPRPAFRFFSADQLPLRPDVPGAQLFEVSLEKSMLTYFELEPGAWFPEHSHVAEQITLVLSGHLAFTLDGSDVVVGPMEAIAISGGTPHAVKSLDAVVAVDSWAPPPERFRRSRPIE